ncbi:TPA: hypothetical protein DCZ16_04035 [Candidatus Peregrinibacteria bacterium]|nr:hypothetical protein [Candidatus Peregrinibacteria bacterium]
METLALALAPETLSYGPEALEALKLVEQFISTHIIRHGAKISMAEAAICSHNIRRVEMALPEHGETREEDIALQVIRDEFRLVNRFMEEMKAYLGTLCDTNDVDAENSREYLMKHLERAVVVFDLILGRKAKKEKLSLAQGVRDETGGKVKRVGA